MMTLNKEYLRAHLVSLKIQREAAEKQMILDRHVLDESTKNFHRIEGSMTLARNLMTVCESQEKTAKAVGTNGAKHSG